MERYKIKSGDIDKISKSFAANVDILKGVGETIGSPDEIEVHLDPAIEDFNEMHEIARWFRDWHKKLLDKEKAKKKFKKGKLMYEYEMELNEAINIFLNSVAEDIKKGDPKKYLDAAVKAFNPVQQKLNDLIEHGEYLEALNNELNDEVDELRQEADISVFDSAIELKGSRIRVMASGNLSITNQDTLEKMLDAIQKDEIVCNQNVNAFF